MKMKGSMGPFLSAGALQAKSSIWKVLGILAAMVCAETALFYRCIRSGKQYVLADAVYYSRISLVFLAALGLIFFVLAGAEGAMEEKSGNLMGRLRLSGRAVSGIKTVYNVLCLIMLFAVQIWLTVWLVESYGEMSGEVNVPPQRLFLAFYRIDFLHCLLPMADVKKWIRNIFLLLAFGTEAAGGLKREKYAVSVLLFALTASWFVSPGDAPVTDLVCCLVYGVVIGVNIRQMWKEKPNERR